MDLHEEFWRIIHLNKIDEVIIKSEYPGCVITGWTHISIHGWFKRDPYFKRVKVFECDGWNQATAMSAFACPDPTNICEGLVELLPILRGP